MEEQDHDDPNAQQDAESDNTGYLMNWLQVLGPAESSQIDEGVGHQLHRVVSTLQMLEPNQ